MKCHVPNCNGFMRLIGMERDGAIRRSVYKCSNSCCGIKVYGSDHNHTKEKKREVPELR